MALGKLIIEIYKYSTDGEMIPKFEFIPCVLDRCLKRNGTTKLEEVIRKGFSDLPRKAQNDEKQKEIMKKLQDAGFGRINVLYNEPTDGADASVELTNITPVSLANADARLKQKDENSIRFYGEGSAWQRRQPGGLSGQGAADREHRDRLRLHAALRAAGGHVQGAEGAGL